MSDNYVQVATDNTVKIILATLANVVISCLNSVFSQQGLLTAVKTDNGHTFQSQKWVFVIGKPHPTGPSIS